MADSYCAFTLCIQPAIAPGAVEEFLQKKEMPEPPILLRGYCDCRVVGYAVAARGGSIAMQLPGFEWPSL
jgi:hypothetical protein